MTLELKKTQERCIQARECLGRHIQTDIMKIELIKKAQDKLDNILYVQDISKNNRDFWWDFLIELRELTHIMTYMTGGRSIGGKYKCSLRCCPFH